VSVLFYIYSSYDYCIGVWAVQTNLELVKLQSKIIRFLFAALCPHMFRKMTRRLRK